MQKRPKPETGNNEESEIRNGRKIVKSRARGTTRTRGEETKGCGDKWQGRWKRQRKKKDAECRRSAQLAILVSSNDEFAKRWKNTSKIREHVFEAKWPNREQGEHVHLRRTTLVFRVRVSPWIECSSAKKVTAADSIEGDCVSGQFGQFGRFGCIRKWQHQQCNKLGGMMWWCSTATTNRQATTNNQQRHCPTSANAPSRLFSSSVFASFFIFIAFKRKFNYQFNVSAV